MKYAYYQLLALNDSKNDGSSNPSLASLWKALVNVCIRNLLWRFGLNILPLISKLMKKGIQFDPSCPFCFEFPESLDHVFLHCSSTKMVWFTYPLGLRIMPDIDPLVWLEKFLSSKDTYGIQPFCTILWNFWKYRNHCVFNKKPTVHGEVIYRALIHVEDFNIANL